MAVDPRWSQVGATPAAIGTKEAKRAGETGGSGLDARWGQVGSGDSVQGQGVSWATLTGQNMEGTSNAFDTTFFQTQTKQDEESATQPLGMRWTRKDATGIVGYDDPDAGLKFGDVYLNGRKQGNLREGYAGMSKSQADEVLARNFLDREVVAKAYENESGKPLTFAKDLSGEIDAKARANTEAYAKGKKAAAFQEDVTGRTEDLNDSAAAQVGNIAAGAAGGAAVGAGIGTLIPIPGVGTAAGAVVGGIVGGFGSWLNRDEQLGQLAQAQAQFHAAQADGHMSVGAFDAFSGFASAAASTLSPLRNLYHGVLDVASEGGVGDSSAAYRTQKQGLGSKILDTALMLGDGIGTFNTGAARLAFTATMGATAAGSTGSVIAGTVDDTTAFNPYTGSYEDIGIGGMLQQGASAGIDVAQTFLGRVGTKALDRGLASEGGFRITTNAAGERMTAGLSVNALIPSEAAVGLSARMFARRSLSRQSLEPTRENMARETARYIDNLTTGRKTIATAMVNGFGEGAEEAVQAVLGATAFGETPTFNEIFDAARQGFGLGAGAGVSIGRSSRSRSTAYLERANVIRELHNQEPISEQEWSNLSERDQAAAGTARTTDEADAVEQIVTRMRQSAGTAAVRAIPEVQRAQDAARAAVQREANNSQTPEPSRMQVWANYNYGPQDYATSLQSAIRDTRARQAVLWRAATQPEVVGQGGTMMSLQPEERARARRQADSDAYLLQVLTNAQRQLDSTSDPVQRTAIVRQLNRGLTEMWHAPADTEQGKAARRSASVLASRYPLNSAGSFQLLRLQIDPRLTAANNTEAVLVGDSTIVPQGGDYDGDRTSNMLRTLLPDDSYEMMRRGAGQLTSTGTAISAKPFVSYHVQLVSDSLAQPSTDDYRAAMRYQATLYSRLGDLLLPAGVPSEVVQDAVRQLSTLNNPGALAELERQLSTTYSTQMRELAIKIDGSPFLVVERIVEDSLREFSNEQSLTEVQPATTGLQMPEVSKAMPKWTQAPVASTSDMMTAAQAARSTDFFRTQTILKYNPLREATETQPQEREGLLSELAAEFTVLNDGIAVSGREQLDEGSVVQRTSLNWLRSLARPAMGELGAGNVNEAMVMLAAQKVPDFTSSGDVLLAQSIMRQVITTLRRKNQQLLENDDTLSQKLNSLERMTHPDAADESGRHTQGGNAIVELFGAYPIDELLGDQGANVATYTVRQLRDKIYNLRSAGVPGAGDARQEFEAALKAHPSYAESEGVRSPYRLLIDAIIESSHQQLSEKNGLATGELTRSSELASQNWGTLHDSVRALMRSRSYNVDDAASMRQAILADEPLARKILALLEDRGLESTVYQLDTVNGTTELQFPTWLYHAFTRSSTAQAEMDVLRATLTNAYANLGQGRKLLDVDKVNDRILRLWLHLDYQANDTTNPNMVQAQAALDTFLKALNDDENTVDDFMRTLNTDLRFRPEQSAPYIAWARDRATVEASRYDGGVSSVLEGTGMRDALREAATAAASALQQSEATREFLDSKASQETLSMLVEARDNPRSVNRPAWDRYVAWADFAKELPTLVSASLWIQQAAGINEIQPNMGDKGQAPGNVAPSGKAIAAQLPVFDSAVGRLTASLTSGSLDDVLADATALQRNRTFLLPDGTVINWQAKTPGELLDMLRDPRTAGITARALGMTAYTYNEETGTNMLAAVMGTGVAGLTADPETALFGSGTSTKLRRLMILEGMAVEPGGTPIIQTYLAQQMNVREAALGHVIEPNSPERARIAVQILEDLADALQALSTIEGTYLPDGSGKDARVPDDVEGVDATGTERIEGTGEDITVINRAILRAVRQARRDGGAGNLVAKLLPRGGAERDAAHEQLKQWLTTFGAQAIQTEDSTARVIARRLTRDLNRVDDPTSPLDIILETYQAHTQPEVRELMLMQLRSFGDISRAVPWAAADIQRALQTEPQLQTLVPLTPDAPRVQPALTEAQWANVARALVAFTMHTQYGIATTSDFELPVFPDLTDPDALDAQRAFWDPTFVELGVDMFAPGITRNHDADLSPLLTVQRQLVARMGVQLEPTSSARAEAAVAKFISPKRTDPKTGTTSGTTGKWHGLVPAAIHSAIGAVMSSAAESATQMAGINPDRLALLAATTKQNWDERPPDSELSTAIVNVPVLMSAVTDGTMLDEMVDIAFPGSSTAPVQRQIAELQGRVVRKILVTLPSGEEISLRGHPRYGSGLALPDSAGLPVDQGGVLDLRLLSESLSSLLLDQGLDTQQFPAVKLHIDFFHPETKGASVLTAGNAYNHSPWFDGVDAVTEAAFSQKSLFGSLHFALDGAVPQAYDHSLKAIKKLTFALEQVQTMPENIRQGIVASGTIDMAGMLARLTDFALRQKIDGDELGVAHYNAMRKLISQLYVVRTIRDGEPTVLSADQVITLQRAGEDLGENAEVVGLPLHFVLALMGERGAAVPAVTAYGDQMFTIDVSRAQQFLNFPQAAWTDAMFGGLVRTEMAEDGTQRWASADLLKQSRLQNLTLPKPRVWDDLSGMATSQRDYLSGYRVHQEEVFEERTSKGDRRWAVQDATVRQRMLVNPNIGQNTMQAIQLASVGDTLAAAMRTAAPTAPRAEYSLNTAWEYKHYGAINRSGIEGQLNSEGLQRVAYGDTVYVPASTFFADKTLESIEKVWPQAREVLSRLHGFGATVVLPPDTVAGDLRSMMRSWLLEHGYIGGDDGMTFDPAPSAGRTRAELAYHSELGSTLTRTNQNRTPIWLTPRVPVVENSILSVNGGLGAREDYFVREVVQTARYSGYSAPNAQARQQLVRILLPLLKSEQGRAYLHQMSGIDEMDQTTAEDKAKVVEAETEWQRALDDFETRLVASSNDPSIPLLPRQGDTFGTGDIIPLVSYNPRGELLGIHLHLHGHEPVAEQLIVGGSFPPGNEALGVEGARLTIDTATVDPSHTSHRGEAVGNPEYLGPQGFQMQLRVKLADLGSKVFEAFTGMKWTTAPPAEDVAVPSHTVMGGLPILGVADMYSPTAKDSDGWWLNTPSQLVEAIGFNTLPYLVRALTGVDYQNSTPEAYGTASTQTQEFLRAFAQRNRNSISAADAVTRDTTGFTQQLMTALQTQIEELHPSTEVDITGQSGDSQAQADATFLRLALTALATNADLSHILSAPGYLNGATSSHGMHTTFTTLLHQQPVDSPVRAAFVSQINERMAQFAANRENGDRFELNKDFTWSMYVTTPQGVRKQPGMLSFPEIRNTGHNDALSQQAQARKQRAKTSETSSAMLYVAWDAPSLMSEPLTADQQVFVRNRYTSTEDGLKSLAYGRGVTDDPHRIRDTSNMKMDVATQRHIFTEALPVANALATPLQMDGWYDGQSAATAAANKRAYEARFRTVLKKLKLTQPAMLEELLRIVTARPASVVERGVDMLNYRDAMSALRLIEQNADEGLMPTYGGAINVVPKTTLQALMRNGYKLRTGRRRSLVNANWNAWVSVMLTNAFSEDMQLRGYPAVAKMIDGLLYSYRADIEGLPADILNPLSSLLEDVQTDGGTIIASPTTRDRLSSPIIQRGQEVGPERELDTADWAYEDVETSARAIIEQRMAAWEKKAGIGRKRRQTMRAEAKRGAMAREEFARTNVLMRYAQLGYVLKTMINPGLYAGAFLELGEMQARERVVSILAGETGRSVTRTPEEAELWKDTVVALADSPEFYKMVWEHTNYQPVGGTHGLERKLQGFTNFATALMNDPTWGSTAKSLARNFLEGAWDAASKMPLEQRVPLTTFLRDLSASPEALAAKLPDAANYGYRRVEYTRKLQDNLVTRVVRRNTESVIGSGGPIVNTLGTLLLRFPTLFLKFRVNTLIQLLGLQAPHAILSTILSDRTKRPGGLKDRLSRDAGGVESDLTDQALMEDSMDLTRAIIRSGVSHTQLFILGSLISSAGFGGDDDDEQKMLNKLRRYQHTPVANDPLSITNDFRNANAWFNDLLPAGLAMPSWILTQFTAPVMGIARFRDTGDFRQVLWGFSNAVGSMPLLNTDNVLNSWELALDLQAQAETAAADGDDSATIAAQKYLVTTIGVLENMLFESSFASQLYQAGDEWDRDPYAKPLLNSDGTIQREGAFNTPRKTDVLQSYVDPVTGETKQGYVGRTDTDAMLHSFGENRPVLAHVLKLIMHDDTFLRQNMPVKTRTINSEAISNEEGQQLLMSIVDNETGKETLTSKGGEAVVRGIHLGAVRHDSPALQNIYLTLDQRKEIQQTFLEDMTAKYLKAGKSKSDALAAAKVEFYGQGYDEPEALGLYDILYNAEIIPYSPKKEYMQLNTTYVMGPNGRPIATGLQRSVLSSIGLLPYETYHDGSTGNLSVDQLLNSVDDARGVNLGMRGLVAMDDSWNTPTDEEIGKAITDALEEIGKKLDDINDTTGWTPFRYGGYGRGFGSGYGSGYARSYGGSSYTPSWGGGWARLNTPRRIDSPYADDLYSINTANPIIRRATIRRERFSSERGRLNQWQ